MSASTNRRAELSLSDVLAEFARWPSARTLAAAVAVTGTARLAVGGWTTRDLWIPLLLLAAYPLIEWCIHVLLLHFKRRRLAGWQLDPLVSRKHRAHHADPTDPELVFLPMPVLWQLLGGATLIGWLAFAELRHGLTFLLSVATSGTDAPS